MRNHVLFVESLNAPLEHADARFRHVLDKTPVMSNYPILKVYLTYNSMPLARGRASLWTLIIVLCCDGSVIGAVLFQSFQSITVNEAKFSAVHDLCIAATEN